MNKQRIQGRGFPNSPRGGRSVIGWSTRHVDGIFLCKFKNCCVNKKSSVSYDKTSVKIRKKIAKVQIIKDLFVFAGIRYKTESETF